MSRSMQGMEYPAFVQEKRAEITDHSAWHGDLTGSEAEALLRDLKDMTYVLRQGEKFDHFYLTYVNKGTNFVHIPFKIDWASQQWFYMNYDFHFSASLKVFIPEIMHQEEDTCCPLSAFTGV